MQAHGNSQIGVVQELAGDGIVLEGEDANGQDPPVALPDYVAGYDR